ncbi:MAG: PilZ domain-containing protein [Proteobacteria bacterium]|nr:PilZ domain-containing protein [Pseudomonadota bacterium]MBU1687040.1 PilZ domain-containing protein [Pseudomonadota bacterium]
MADDLRRMKRRHLIYYLDVYEVGTDKLLGHLVDITTKGIKLVSKDPLPIGTDYAMKMILPEGYFDERELLLQGRAMWSSNDINPDFYDTGFEIPEIDGKTIDIIKELIEAIGFMN